MLGHLKYCLPWYMFHRYMKIMIIILLLADYNLLMDSVIESICIRTQFLNYLFIYFTVFCYLYETLGQEN